MITPQKGCGVMELWILSLIVFGAGFIGGSINASVSGNLHPFPKRMYGVLTPGFIVTAITSGIAAFVSWGLYGPFSTAYIVGGPSGTVASQNAGLTLSALVSAVLIGVGGSRWLTNEAEKRMLKRKVDGQGSS